MQPVSDHARLSGDAFHRTPRRWRGALLVVAGVLGLASLGVGLSGASIEPTSTAVAVPETPCQQQTWPYLSNACLQRAKAVEPQRNEVRVLPHGRDLPGTVFIYPEAPKPAVAKAKASKGKQATASRDAKQERQPQRQTTRRAAPQRDIPNDKAYRAYGYEPRSPSPRR